MTRDQIELLCRNIQASTGDWKPEESILLRHDAEQRQVINTLNDLVKAKEARCDRYQVEITKLRETLTALHALVKGECPRLLDEDSGGDAELDLKIEQALKDLSPRANLEGSAPCRNSSHMKQIATLREALERIVDLLGECRLDHHGNCQEHFISDLCEVKQAQQALKEHP